MDQYLAVYNINMSDEADVVPPLRTVGGSKTEGRLSSSAAGAAARPKYLSMSEASFIPSSVRREIEQSGELPDVRL